MGSLRRLFTTGAIGCVDMGAEAEAVRDLLGPPDSFCRRPRGRMIWCYGIVELYLERSAGGVQAVHMVVLRYPMGHEGARSLVDRFGWHGWLPEDMTSPSEMERFAERNHLNWCMVGSLTIPGMQSAFQVGNAGLVVFSEHSVLDKIIANAERRT